MSRPVGNRGKPFGGRGAAALSSNFGQAGGSQLETLLKQARASGQLNASNRDWDTVPDAVWRINIDGPPEARDVSLDRTESWWEQKDLTKLILASNKLWELSDDVRQLVALTVLDVHDNQLASLPEAIGDLEHLSKLTLNDNRLSRLPPSLCRLSELNSLVLDSNELTELPLEINLLQSLSVLKVSHNKLERLPESVGQLRLQSLNINNNCLTELPVGTGRMPALRELIAHSNRLTSMPNMEGCKSLTRLDLHLNRLQKPPVVPSGLKELTLSDNVITSLDADWQAPSLISLDLSSNKLTELPERIVEFQSLERLNLSFNSISSVPYIIGTMPLKALHLEGNALRSIRPAVLQKGTQAVLKFLRERMPTDESSAGAQEQTSLSAMTSDANQQLHFSHELASTKILSCKKKSKPITDETILAAAEAGVAKVDFSFCELSAVPDRLSSLVQSLTHLELNNNRLSATLTGVSCLTALVMLDVRCNALTDIESLASLTKLQQLMLCSNRFSAIPEQAYLLPQLQVLLVSSNQIEDINVDGLSQLKRLDTLNLQSNSIAHIPPTLGNLEQLRSLELTGNRFRVPRPAIISKGTNAVLAYLRDRIPA